MRAGVIVTFTIICAVIAWIDIQKQKIYNEAVAVLFVPAIVSFFVFPEVHMVSRIWGAVSVSGIMLMVCFIKAGAFGGGDIKMMIPAGLFLGLEKTLVAGVLALAIGLPFSFVNWLRGKHFPFGPSLCLGSVISLIWGDYIWQWLIEI